MLNVTIQKDPGVALIEDAGKHSVITCFSCNTVSKVKCKSTERFSLLDRVFETCSCGVNAEYSPSYLKSLHYSEHEAGFKIWIATFCIFSTRLSKRSTHYFVLKLKQNEHGKIFLYRSGKQVFTYAKIDLVLNYLVTEFKDAEGIPPLPCTTYMDVMRNNFQSVKDISSLFKTPSDYYRLSMKERRSLLYYYKKYGIAKVREKILGVNFRPLLNLVLEGHFLNVLTSLKTSLKFYNANQLYNLLEEHKHSDVVQTVEKASTLGISLQKISNGLNTSRTVVNDSVGMLSYLKLCGIDMKVKNLIKDHDIIMAEYIKVKDCRETVKLPLCFNKPLSSPKYILEPAKTNRELIKVGRSMKICVGSYFESVMSRYFDIYVVREKETNTPVLCISLEVKKGVLSQVKLERNASLSSSNNEELKGLFYDWCELNNINPFYYDPTH